MIKAILYSLFLILTSWFPSTTASSYTLNAYDFSFKDIDGNNMKLKDYKGKVLLVINTASFCGYTSQYKAMQELWDNYKDKDFVLIGVPSNDFYQESESEEEVKNFCERTFGVNFPMTSITSVRGKNAHPFYKWAKLTYGKKTIPLWNFKKLLFDRQGRFVEAYGSSTKPNSQKVIDKINSLLEN